MKFPAGSIRHAVAVAGDGWHYWHPRVGMEHRDGCAMLSAERMRLSLVKPASRVDWREFTERNARGERHPIESDGYPGAVL